MLRPVIMIGWGGSGQKAVRYIRDAVRRRLEHSGWEGDFPKAWQFIGLDTLNIQESPGEIPTIPASDYKSIALQFQQFSELNDALLAQHSPQDAHGYKELIGWRPQAEQVDVPLRSGAGQMRAVGRTAGVVSLGTVVRPRIREAFGACDAGGPELQRISELLGVPVPPGTTVPDPIVVVLGSMAGGTGAGILLDVIDLVRRTDRRGAFPIAVIFTPDIFNVTSNDAMSANGLAMMCELMSAYWDDERSHSELIPDDVRVDNRGPHSTFLIGRKNLGGIDLNSSRNVYRAVGEALASWVSSSSVQDSIYNFITVNWPMNAPDNMGGYPFDRVRQRGVISSFGSATLSIGRDRFREFASKLLMRELLENLYEGHLKKAPAELGEEAKNLTDAAVLEALVARHRTAFMQACELDERGTHANQITDRFASNSLTRDELKLIKDEMVIPFGSQTGTPADWHTRLNAQARQVVRPSSQRAESGFEELLSTWGPEVFERILRTTSNYIGRYGLKVAGELVQTTMTEVAQVSSEVHQEAYTDRQQEQQFREEAKSTLRNAGTKDSLNFMAAPVQAALDSFGKSILASWRAERRERTAAAMEALSTQVLGTLSLQISQAHGRIHEMVSRIDGEPAMVDTWPTYRGGIPEGFLPSPLEFYLEEAESWPGALERLAAEAMELSIDVGYQPTDPVDATRYLINAGDFRADQYREIRPVAWITDRSSHEPQWVPGRSPQIEVASEYDQIADRISSWMNRPSSPMARYFGEGLREYLNSSDRFGTPVRDHTDRLRSFRLKLDEARQQSQPLIELDLALNAVVHTNHPQIGVMPLVQGFPFPLGHPARAIVEEVMGTEGAHFTDVERESVLLSSFIEYAVHPMVVSSFVQPLGTVLNSIGNRPDNLRGAFWLWRRTKILEDFIPLPDETRLAIMRGFAVSRMLGYITADPSRQISITGTSGPLRFPFPLLTDVSQDNILPALLESFGLCFGKVATEHSAAFNAYSRLYQLGEGTGHVYVLAEEAEKFLESGVIPFTPEDASRHSKAQADTEEERSHKLQEYLELNLQRFRTLESRPFTGQESRDRFGTVTPEDTLTVELANDLIVAYDAVLSAIVARSSGGGVV